MHASRNRAGRYVGPLVFALLFAVAGPPAACGQDPWRVGSELRRELKLSRSITWSQNPLRAGLDRLARESRVAVFLDRRVDPDQRVSVSTPLVPLSRLLELVGDSVGIGVAQVDSILYFGPAEDAWKLEALIELKKRELEQAGGALRAAMNSSRSWSWPDLTSPQELLDRFTTETGVQLEGRDQVPHDLWARGDWPPLAARDRLSLLLAGFGLTYEPVAGGRSVKLVPIPDRLVVTRSYDVKLTTPEFRNVQRQFGDAAVRRSGSRLTMTGRTVDHRRLARHLDSLKPEQPDQPAGTISYTLKVERQQVGSIINTIAQKAGLEVQLDPRVGREQLSARVTFDVTNVSLESLLMTVLEPVHLTYQQAGKTLTLLPAD